MRCSLLTLITSLAVVTTTAAQAGHHPHGYPKVSTFSGGYYGPTQANYQYQRRYGHPWHGQGGFYGNGSSYYGSNFGSYSGFGSYGGFGWPTYGYQGFGYGFGSPYSLGGFGYSLGGLGYSSYYSRSSLFGPSYGAFGYGYAPLISYPLGVTIAPPPLVLNSPGVYTPFWSTNPYVNSSLLNNGYLWQQQVPDLITPQVETLDVEPLGKSNVLPPPSTPQAQLRSLQQQQQGDARLHDLDYLQAYLRYQEAAESAADRVEPHYRMGITLAGMKRFDKAVRELKRASELDPAWFNTVSLDALLGADNQIGKVQLKQRAADWALADAHDADRLYLLGTLLYLDGDRDRARILFDTAVALVGNEPYLTAFLAAPAEPPVPTDSTPTPTEIPSFPPPVGNPVLPSLTAPSGPVFPSRFP